MAPIGGHLGDRQHDEGPFGQSRVRYLRHLAGRADEVVIGYEVQIQHPGLVARLAHAPKVRLDLVEQSQERRGRQVGFDLGHAVDVPGLVQPRLRCGAIPAGAPADLDLVR